MRVSFLRTGRLDSVRTHLLVWLVLALRVADLGHEVLLLLEHEVLNLSTESRSTGPYPGVPASYVPGFR